MSFMTTELQIAGLAPCT